MTEVRSSKNQKQMPHKDTQDWLPPYSQSLGLELKSVEPEKVIATLRVRPDMGNRNGVMHGGAIMGAADSIGGVAAALNLEEGASTTTLESKTNFIRPIQIEDQITLTCIPLHRGRKTMIWQTTVALSDGRPAAIVTQTQLTLTWSD